MTSPIVGYVIIIACHVGVSNFLKRHGAPSHSITKGANDEVKRALIALLAATATIVGSEWLQIQIGLRLSGFLSLGMTLLAFTNPLMTMIFVAPYRAAVLNLFGIRKIRITARGPTTFAATDTDAVLG
ncbi:hypothetical protein AAVH_14814 [Aphelenchoides avenae]|nr:hypothetical protein AAVH_14814 [Aphelenchus avenae]